MDDENILDIMEESQKYKNVNEIKYKKVNTTKKHNKRN